MVLWLWYLGTPLWISLVFVGAAMLIFVGVTRIVAEAGLAAVRSPMTAPDLVIHGLGSTLVGPTGVVNLSLAYIWAADIRIFALATCANALKLVEEMDLRSRRLPPPWRRWSSGRGGDVMIFHMAYRHGGQFNAWFQRGPGCLDNALNQLAVAGWTWAWLPGRGRDGPPHAPALSLWPLHPLGSIGAEYDGLRVVQRLPRLVDQSAVLLRWGRPAPAQSALFLPDRRPGALWPVAVYDHFTKVGNSIFWYELPLIIALSQVAGWQRPVRQSRSWLGWARG